jgi:hypothetical protein
MQIYLFRDNQQIGPFSEAEVRAQLASGAITRETLVWWDGQADWQQLGQTTLGTASATPGGFAPTPTVGAPVAGAAPAMVVATGGTSVLAIVSLVAGIIGLPGAICSLFDIPVALAAIITGHIARSQIKKDPSKGGKGMALAGLICGYVGILFVAAVITFSVLIALGNQTKNVFKTITSQLEAATNNAPASPDTFTTNAAPANPTNAPSSTPDTATNSAPAAPGQ